METEYIICNILVTILSFLTFYFAYLNFFWNLLKTSAANRFGHEMDNIMGKMLAIPNFSKLEGLMMLLSSIGCVISWSTDSVTQFYAIILLSFALMYFLICLVYFILVEDGVPIAVILITFISGIIVWKYISFFDAEVYGQSLFDVGKVFGVLVLVAGLKMVHGAMYMKEEIKYFQEVVKFCKENESFVWESGKDAPNGFQNK